MNLLKLIILTALWTGASFAMEKETMDTILWQELFAKYDQEADNNTQDADKIDKNVEKLALALNTVELYENQIKELPTDEDLIEEDILMSAQITNELQKPKNVDLMMVEKDQLEKSKKIDRTFVCKYCATSYKQKKHLRDHEQIRHPFEFAKNHPYVCGIDGCDQKFANNMGMNAHRTKIHSINKKSENHGDKIAGKFSCDYCQRSYNQQRFLSKHQREMHSTEYEKKASDICKICNRSFLSKWGLNIHMTRIHSLADDTESDLLIESVAKRQKTI